MQLRGALGAGGCDSCTLVDLDHVPESEPYNQLHAKPCSTAWRRAVGEKCRWIVEGENKQATVHATTGFVLGC